MKRSVDRKSPLFAVICILFAMLIIPIKSELNASNNSLQDSSKHGKMSHMQSDMQKMHKQMMGIKMTGNPDYDFAQMMIQHHKGAIDMSKKEVSKGKDQQVKSMAKEVIDSQNKDMKELRAFVKKDKPSKTNKGQSSDETGSGDKKMMDKMNDMQKEMQDMKMTGNQDQDYVSMMIIHHQHGIDMAKDYMDNAKDDNLKKMAQKMADENKKQIDKMKDWQSSHK